MARICLLFLVGILLFYFVKSFYTIPIEGDSLTYHIPIAKSIIDGSFISPHFTVDQLYFPGSSEAILAIFIVLGIPLNLFNVLAIALLGFACYKLFLMFSDDKNMAQFRLGLSGVAPWLRDH